MKSSGNAERAKRRCPYCDEELILNPAPYCKPCQVELRFCPKCNIVVEREAEACHECGGELEWK
jgi:hypothetical protein